MYKIIEKFIPESIRTPVAQPVGQPNIVYVERLVDFKKTPESLAWRDKTAEYDPTTNTIRVFVNKEVPDVISIPKRERLRPIDINDVHPFFRKWEIPRTLAHEMRHVRNGAYENYIQPYKTKRYYDVAILLGLNEVSAYAAERLADDAGQYDLDNLDRIKDMDSLWEAVCYGISMAMCPAYLEEYSGLISQQLVFYTSDMSPEAQIRHAQRRIAQHPVKYCRSTRIIADYFMTFGNIHVLDKKVKMPPEVKQDMTDFRRAYEDMVRQTLQDRADILTICVEDLRRIK